MSMQVMTLVAFLTLQSTSPLTELLNLSPEKSAISQIQEHAKLLPADFALQDGDELSNYLLLPIKNGFIVKAQRLHQGIVVRNEMISMRFDAKGKLLYSHNNFTTLQIETEPQVEKTQALATAVNAHFGFNLDPTLLKDSPLKAQLMIAPRYNTLAYEIVVPGLVPWDFRRMLINAKNGKILESLPLHRYAENDAKAFLPHPGSSETPDDPADVSLANLDTNDPLITEGSLAISKSCDTSDDNVRIRTCEDLAPAIVGESLAGLACSGNFASLTQGLEDYILAFCNTTHRAFGDATNGFEHEPLDEVSDYSSDDIFEDPFAEIHGYYHLDKVSAFFTSLGHTISTPLHALVNVTAPSPDLIQCARTEWENTTERSTENAREVIRDCTTDDVGYMSFDNAFYLNGDTASLVDVDTGIYLFQGSFADFAYDGDIIYHEYGHALADQVSSLGGGQFEDSFGINDSPGALNEGFADYFSSALAEDGVVGGYVGERIYGSGGAIRTLEHSMKCPDYWNGEVHDDSRGFAAALWAIRARYQQTEVNETTGDTVRVFDRVVYEALASLGSTPSEKDAVSAIISFTKNEDALEDDDASEAQDVFAERNLLDCERARKLSESEPIEKVYFAGKGGGVASGLMGGGSYTPYAPGPVQFYADVAELRTSADIDCLRFEATIAGLTSADVIEQIFLPSGEEPEWAAKLIYAYDEPVELEFVGSDIRSVEATNRDGSINMALQQASGNAVELSAVVNVPSDNNKVYFAIGTVTEQGMTLSNIKIETTGLTCESTDDGEVEETGGEDDEIGQRSRFGCQSAPGSQGWLLVLLLGLFGLRLRGRQCDN